MKAALRLSIVVAVFVSLVSWGSGSSSALADDGQRVITFTKWITTFPQMAGFVGGAAVGAFAGEVLTLQNTTNPQVTSITRLVAIYDIQAGPHSFTALVQGGQNNQTDRALLDGVILGGWFTGARVQVEYQVKTDCAGAPAGTCFQGTIRIEPEAHDVED